LHELQRAHDQVRGSIAPRRLELELDLAGGVDLHPLRGKRWSRDAATQLKARGVPARLLWFPDENHWVLKPRNSKLWYGEFFAWLAGHDPSRGARQRAGR